MSEEILMQFVGFESKATAREYTFTVREAVHEPREFTVEIANEVFSEHRLRFQDAPSICSLKLRRELTSHANHPPDSHFHITDEDLDDYRRNHASPSRSVLGRKSTEEDF
jgi:hypothetical protein